MIKKNLKLILAAALLVLVTAIVYFQKSNSGSEDDDRNFAVKDTSSITKIFLANRNGNEVALVREMDNSWTLNSKYKARITNVKSLMDCIYSVQVQMRVSKSMYNTVMKELAANAIKCEIFLNNSKKPYKVYYVGGSTQDVLGTFMKLENSELPFITVMPGFQGYLTPRYTVNEREWRETFLFKNLIQPYKSVEIKYHFHPENSFRIVRTEIGFQLINPYKGMPYPDMDTIRIQNYLSNFAGLSFETWEKYLKPDQIDSLKSATPSTLLSITDAENKTVSLNIYPKPISENSIAKTDSLGRPLKFDLDRVYTFVNDEQELVTLQFYHFNKVFITIHDLKLK